MTPETRTFTSPSGRTWTAALFAGVAGGAPVLRFRAGDVVLDLADYPRDWAGLPDAALVALARRGEPPRFASPVPETQPVAERPVGVAASAGAGPHGEAAFTDRLSLAFLLLQMRGGQGGRIERVSPGAFAALIEERLRAAGHPRAVPPSEVVTWFADAVPDLHTTQAIAEACDVDPGWLAFGAASRAPAPTAARAVAPAADATRRQRVSGVSEAAAGGLRPGRAEESAINRAP